MTQVERAGVNPQNCILVHIPSFDAAGLAPRNLGQRSAQSCTGADLYTCSKRGFANVCSLLGQESLQINKVQFSYLAGGCSKWTYNLGYIYLI